MIHSTVFTAADLLTVILPFVNLTLAVISNPSVSLISAFDHFTSYVPSGQFSGTVYERVNTVAPSAATFSFPLLSLKRNLFPFELLPISDE